MTETRKAVSYVPLDDLAQIIRGINTDNGWKVFYRSEWDSDYKIPAMLALIHSEVSEALEAFRKHDQANFLEEMADTLIRVLDCVGGFGESFDSIVQAKLAKNRGRGHKHGGKRI